MHNINRKAQILRAVAAGKTLKNAGEEAGISAGQTVNNLHRICRALGLPYDLKAIRSNPEYLSRLDKLLSNPASGLRSLLVDRLVQALLLSTKAELTPEYVSNLTASDLIRSGITLGAIAEIQEWLQGYDRSLRRKAPESDEEIREVRRAISLLNAFYFDTDRLEVQYDNLTGKNDEELCELPCDEEEGAE
ncbi:hypothetical protein [uncultured Zoogloea sp.]|uniref:hypothetical protein n=1 Tax=uncultured Zoogloea sp. TaxID=160237 RepID=UPI002624483C|nr:hypothetical protein [uncultured Zoogloea sp.]